MNTILLVFQNICVGKVRAHHQHIGGLEIQRYIAVMQITVMIEQFQEFGHMNNQMIDPCPFCGSADIREVYTNAGPLWWSVECLGCHAEIISDTGPAAAAAAWNTRAYNPDERLREALVEARTTLKPFAECAASYAEDQQDSRQVIERVPGIRVIGLGHLRYAADCIARIDSALSPLPQGDD